MKIGTWSFVILGGALLFLILWPSNPRSTTNAIAGINIPESAQLIERRGSFGEIYLKWRIEPAFAATLVAPNGATQLPDDQTDWHPFNLDFFGALKRKDVASDAEALYYRTSFWSVALIRSKTEQSLIVAGLYIN